jgi:hypothetical protein
VAFVNTPLSDAVESLSDRSGIDIRIDLDGLNAHGISMGSPATTVTATLDSTPLHSALDRILKPLQLTWTVKNGGLLITTLDIGESTQSKRNYDVTDLVENGNYQPLIKKIMETVSPYSWASVGGPGSIDGSTSGRAESLVVSQSYSAHFQIMDFLKGIRQEKNKRANPHQGRVRKGNAGGH